MLRVKPRLIRNIAQREEVSSRMILLDASTIKQLYFYNLMLWNYKIHKHYGGKRSECTTDAKGMETVERRRLLFTFDQCNSEAKVKFWRRPNRSTIFSLRMWLNCPPTYLSADLNGFTYMSCFDRHLQNFSSNTTIKYFSILNLFSCFVIASLILNRELLIETPWIISF